MRGRGSATIAVVAAMTASTCAFSGAEAEGQGPEGRSASPAPVGMMEVEGRGGDWIPVQVELALTPDAHRRGLMFREELPDGRGMLFIFPRREIRSFWMKNTLISLDMIFIDEDARIVGIIHEAAPLTTESRSIARPSRYVLEVPGGWSRAKGVREGNRARFQGLPGVAEPFGPPGTSAANAAE